MRPQETNLVCTRMALHSSTPVQNHDLLLCRRHTLPIGQPRTIRIESLGKVCPVRHHDVLHLFVFVWCRRFPAIENAKHIPKLAAMIRSQPQPESWSFRVVSSTILIGEVVQEHLCAAAWNISSQVLRR